MNTDAPNRGWLLDTILTGLQKLLLLSLDRSPAAEVIDGTAYAWLEALVTGRDWLQVRDQPRFERAFATLAQTARRWPTPSELLDAMPGVEQHAKLQRPTAIPDTREGRSARLQHLLGELYNPRTADPDYEPTKAQLRVEEKLP